MTKIILAFAGGLAIGLLLVWGWNTYKAPSAYPATPQTTTPKDMKVSDTATDRSTLPTSTSGSIIDSTSTPPTSSTSVRVENQAAGDTVVVAHVTLPNAGWVVVHEERNGFIGNALGAARKDAGDHTNATISLLRPTASTTRYWIVLYSDNNDRQFNLADDFPFRDSDANPITRSFMTF